MVAGHPASRPPFHRHQPRWPPSRQRRRAKSATPIARSPRWCGFPHRAGVGIIVRSLDLPQWWNLDLPEPIRQKVSQPPRSVAAKGVADASLYRRMRRVGLVELICFPSLLTLDRPEGPILRPREDHALSLLTAEEVPIWQAARKKAAADGVLMVAWPFHCAVGTKPSA